MKQVLLIFCIIFFFVSALSLSFWALNRFGYNNVMDGTEDLYSRLHKKMIVSLIIGIVFALIGATCMFGLCGFKSNKIDTTTPIFETQNIKSITLYRLPDQPDGIEVPSEHIEEITAWLGTFTVSKKVEDALCGVNMFTFKIEYSDGSVVTSGTDTTTINGVIYHTNKGRQPDCIEELFRINYSEE